MLNFHLANLLTFNLVAFLIFHLATLLDFHLATLLLFADPVTEPPDSFLAANRPGDRKMFSRTRPRLNPNLTGSSSSGRRRRSRTACSCSPSSTGSARMSADGQPKMIANPVSWLSTHIRLRNLCEGLRQEISNNLGTFTRSPNVLHLNWSLDSE